MTHDDVTYLQELLVLAEKDATTPGHIRLCTVLSNLLTFLERDAEPDHRQPATTSRESVDREEEPWPLKLQPSMTTNF